LLHTSSTFLSIAGRRHCYGWRSRWILISVRSLLIPVLQQAADTTHCQNFHKLSLFTINTAWQELQIGIENKLQLNIHAYDTFAIYQHRSGQLGRSQQYILEVEEFSFHHADWLTFQLRLAINFCFQLACHPFKSNNLMFLSAERLNK
jgi:hypothetical protein